MAKDDVSITIKLKHVDVGGERQHAHWWLERGGERGESYGWWPKNRPEHESFGTHGELNGITKFGGSSTRDPCHGQLAERSLSVKLGEGQSVDRLRTQCKVLAGEYTETWRWSFDDGDDARRFPETLLRSLGLEVPKNW